ncbi:hypothetical protein [Streptomyces sp. NPDC058964]|uniref:hypothetical protein n=1 Tax=Streptomyces sp. NPDC058964 TaxID=3346681 RepID=UPI0036A06719
MSLIASPRSVVYRLTAWISWTTRSWPSSTTCWPWQPRLAHHFKPDLHRLAVYVSGVGASTGDALFRRLRIVEVDGCRTAWQELDNALVAHPGEPHVVPAQSRLS